MLIVGIRHLRIFWAVLLWNQIIKDISPGKLSSCSTLDRHCPTVSNVLIMISIDFLPDDKVNVKNNYKHKIKIDQ